jgi:hypothetical protein
VFFLQSFQSKKNKNIKQREDKKINSIGLKSKGPCDIPYKKSKRSPKFRFSFSKIFFVLFLFVSGKIPLYSFVWFRFVSFRFVLFRLISFRFVLFRFVSSKKRTGLMNDDDMNLTIFLCKKALN